jgi:hypothetical protein
MAREENLGEAARLAEQDSLTISFPRPHDPQAVSRAAAQLLALSGAGYVSRDERLRQAVASLGDLARLADWPDRYRFYDLLRQQEAIVSALNTPELSVQAARVLGRLGSPLAQRALVELASQNSRPLAARRAAAAAFADATGRCGLGLTSQEIRLQYDRYNQSAALDRATQQLLGFLLDSIEASSSRLRGREDTSRLR